MANRTFYFDIDRAKLVTSEGGNVTVKPTITFGEAPTWSINVVRVGTDTATAVSLSDAVSWEAAIAQDWSETTAPCCRTLNANIDSSGKASGVINVELNANTQQFLNVVTDPEEVASVNGWFRLKGMDSNGHVMYCFVFQLIIWNDIDKDNLNVDDLDTNYYTKSEAEAVFQVKDGDAVAGDVAVMDVNGNSVDSAVPLTKVSQLDNSNIVVNNVNATKIIGVIPVTNLPVTSILPKMVVVADETARFALTTASVHTGDSVKQSDTGVMYYVKDDTKLDSEDGYESYSAEAAASVPWTGITGVPAHVTEVGAISMSDGDIVAQVAGVLAGRTPAQVKTSMALTKSDVGLSNVLNYDTTTTANITDSTDKRFVTDAQRTVLGNTSGTNTGDETKTSITTKIGSGVYEPADAAIQSHLVNTSNPHTVTKTQVGLSNVTNDSQVKRSEMDATLGVATLDASKLLVQDVAMGNVVGLDEHIIDTASSTLDSDDAAKIIHVKTTTTGGGGGGGYVVSGAGMSAYNGTYTQAGTNGSYPYYTYNGRYLFGRFDGQLFWYLATVNLAPIEECDYLTDGATPATNVWDVMMGSMPKPTVTAQQGGGTTTTYSYDASEVKTTDIVVGPASATADRIAVYNGTTGKMIKDGGQTITDLYNAGTAVVTAHTALTTTAHGGLVPPTRTVNGHALSGNVTVTKSDVGLGNVPNTDCTVTTPITDTSVKRFCSDAEKATWNGVASGSWVPTTRKVNNHALTGDISVTAGDLGLGNVENKSSATIRSEITSSNVTGALGYTPLASVKSICGNAMAGSGNVNLTPANIGITLNGDTSYFVNGQGGVTKLPLINDLTYTQGTFTPTVSGSGSTPTFTNFGAGGKYVRLGQLMFVVLDVAWTGVTGGSGEVRISGLPLPGNGAFYQGLAIANSGCFTTSSDWITAEVVPNTDRIVITENWGNASVNSQLQCSQLRGRAGANITITGTYLLA